MGSSASAGNVVLRWSASADPGIIGYRVYIGTTPRTYVRIWDVGLKTQATLPSLAIGQTYYFAVSDYDLLGEESPYSNEVLKTFLALPPGNIDLMTVPSAVRVDGYDLFSLESAWGATPADLRWNPLADLDSNGMIDGSDLNILMTNFGSTP